MCHVTESGGVEWRDNQAMKPGPKPLPGTTMTHADDYQTWLDTLPENLADTATANRLRMLCELDLSELASAEPPRGFALLWSNRHHMSQFLQDISRLAIVARLRGCVSQVVQNLFGRLVFLCSAERGRFFAPA